MLNAFATSPTPSAVTVVAKDQRASTAPKQEDLFRLLKGRLAPVKLDAEWFRGGNGMISKAFANILENPNAQVIYWDKAQYNVWATEAEAQRKEQQEKKQVERKAQEQAQAQAKAEAEAEAKAKDEAKNKYKHGYVYAFRYRHKNVEWMKVGMTDNDDEVACWLRIKDYIKQHDLPREGWSFVGFIACTQARELEQRLHRRLRKYRIKQGSMRELFRCSMLVYEAVTEAEYEFITANEPDTEAEEIERAKQAEAKRQAQRDREQQAKEKAEREAREKAEHERIEREAREKAVRQARERAERERLERDERVLRERAEREAREKAEREAREKAERERIAREAREKAVRQAREKAERERVEREELERQKQKEALEQVKRDSEAREKAERDVCEQAEREAHWKTVREEREAQERVGRGIREKAAREKAERDHTERELFLQRARELTERKTRKQQRISKLKAIVQYIPDYIGGAIVILMMIMVPLLLSDIFHFDWTLLSNNPRMPSPVTRHVHNKRIDCPAGYRCTGADGIPHGN